MGGAVYYSINAAEKKGKRAEEFIATKYPSTIAYIPDNANAIKDGITYLKNNDL